MMGALAALYAVVSAFATLTFNHEDISITPVWPAAGVGLVTLLWLGRSAWPAIAFGALTGQLVLAFVADEPLHLAFLTFMVAGNTLGPLIALHMLGNWHPELLLRGGTRSALSYPGAALVVAFISTLLGVTGMTLAGIIPAAQQGPAALDWFVGDVFGVAICGPALLAILERLEGKQLEEDRRISAKRRGEKVIWSGLLLLSIGAWASVGTLTESYRLALFGVPAAFLCWSALRFDSLFTTCMAAVLSLGFLTAFELPLGLPHPTEASDRFALMMVVLVLGGFPVLVSSVMQRLRAVTGRLRFQARHDRLTGLPNRRSFEEELELRLSRGDAPVAVAILDVDNFRLANDRGGQACGDAYLKQAAVLLTQALLPEERIYRLGGDEFAAILPPANYASRMETLRRTISGSRLPWGEQLIVLKATAGAIAAPPRSTLREALQAASIACKEAKDRGGDRSISVDFDKLHGLAQHKAVAWAGRIAEALDEDRFVLHAQMIKPLRDESDRARLEVLVRMHEPDGTLILPSNFIPAAERFRLIQQIDALVARKSIQWLAQHIDHLDWLDCLSINLSGPSISDSSLERQLVRWIEKWSVPPDRLSFEITERVAISDLSAARHFVDRMRALGCRFSLDDFGAGVSSFSYLKALRVDTVKIDGSFIEGMIDDSVDAATVDSIRNIARMLGMVTVAEYVSSAEILRAVKRLGIDYAQGYAIGKAVPLADFVASGDTDNVVDFNRR